MRRSLPFSLMMLAAAAGPVGAADRRAPVVDRLVLELQANGRPTVKQQGDQVEISLPGQKFELPATLPPGVIGFSGGSGKATITLAQGVRFKTVRNGRRLALEMQRPAPARVAADTPRPGSAPTKAGTAKPSSTKPEPAKAEPVKTEPVKTGPIQSEPTKPEPVQAASVPPPLPAPQTDPAPAEAAPATAEKPVASESTAIHVPAGPEIGAVAFRRGNLGVVVFDDHVDIGLDRDDVLPPQAAVQQLQGATILTLPLADKQDLAISRDRDGWVVDYGASKATAAVQTAADSGIAFQFPQPGRALTVSDPITGQILLLGTLRQAGAEHTLIDARRTATGYVMLPTWLGIALEVTSDSVDLRATKTGFTLRIPDRSAPGIAATAARENQFGIPNAPAETLMRQLDAQIASAATSAPRSRGTDRLSAAKTMLALGMAAEAQALLSLAASDNPAVANDPKTAALSGIAAVLAQRPGDATGLDNPNLPASGDVALWRSLRDVEQGHAAPTLGSFWPVLARYPRAVRQRVGPTVIEAAIENGDTVPVSELEGPTFAFARALQKQKAGDVPGALAGFDEIAKQRDERDSVRASVAATELRLAKNMVTPAAAADQIEQQTVRWRGNGQELAMRLRVAELRTLAGQWRAALENLRRTEALFPEAKDRIAALKSGVFTLLLFAKEDTLNPLEVVTIAGDFADCIPEGNDGVRIAELLADKLVALDLPSRAIPVLQRLADGTTTPVPKAVFALRLARLQLESGDAAKAESILQAIGADTLPAPESDQRIILLARARAGRGDPAGAATLLAQLQTTESEEMRAGFLAKAGNWAESLKALQNVAGSLIPETGELNEKQQDLLLREATAAVQADDLQAVRDLKRYDARMTPPRADLFHLLTAKAVESPDDLPRAARELAMSRSLPEKLNALKLR